MIHSNIVYASTFKENNSTISALQGANYVCENIYFVNELAFYFGYETNIESCSYQKITVIMGFSQAEEGSLVLFDHYKGYLILGANFNIYDLSFEISDSISEMIGNIEHYDLYRGFSSLNRIDKNYEYEMSSAVINDGTTQEGIVLDRDLYVDQEYGEQYSLYRYSLSSGRAGFTQGALSVYEEVFDIDDDGSVDYASSEGNCATVSAYNYLTFLKYDKSYSALPYAYTTFAYNPAIYEGSLYFEMRQEDNYWIYDGHFYFGEVKPIKQFSYLYNETRQAAIDVNAYPWGLNVWQTRDVVNNVLSNHGYTNAHHSVIEVPTSTTVTNNINAGNGFIMSMLLDNVYGTHEVFVTGYYTYLWVQKFLFFNINHYVFLLDIRDGWGAGSRYYDFSITGRALTIAFITKD